MILHARDVQQGPVAVLQFRQARRKGRRSVLRSSQRGAATCHSMLPPWPFQLLSGLTRLAEETAGCPTLLQPIPSGLHGCWADVCYAPA